MLEALERGEISKGSVVIIRYEGPQGGPGMPEMRKFCTTRYTEKYSSRSLT